MNQDLIAALREIADVYATVQGLLNSKTKGGGRRGMVWASKLHTENPLRMGHILDVCDEIAKLEREPVPDGKTMDLMPYFIRAEAQKRWERDEARYEQDRKYHRQPKKRIKRLVKIGNITR